MNTKRETIKISMMSGRSKDCEVVTFTHGGIEYAARKVSRDLCFIVHRATGVKVTSEGTGDQEEAAQGFVIAATLGAYDLSGVAAAARKHPTIN